MSRSRRHNRGRNKRLPEQAVEARIEALSAEGRGIAHVDDRTVFIDNALVGERVRFQYSRLNAKIAEGRALEILEASADRVEPACRAFSACGGCALQHMQPKAQLAHKQKTFQHQLAHLAHVSAENLLEPLSGPLWSYRHKARLSVRYVPRKQKVLVGFRERSSSYVTETERCEILHQSVGAVIDELSDCIGRMQLKQRIPQIEVAIGDAQAVLVVRHLDPMPEDDRRLLRELAMKHDLSIYLQAGAPEELEALWPENPRLLYYDLPDHDVRIEFQPSDFTQVNPEINRQMLNRAIEFLQLDSTDRVLDLFSGLGNFALPMARRCAQVVAVEGSLEMVRKGRDNAQKNNIDNIEFVYADLYSDEIANAPWLKQKYSKVLLDPPRSGADAMLKYFASMGAQRIVYVSCHPATLARDADTLVNRLGYRLTDAGIMDMFPHTTHVESIAVFVK